MMRRFWQERGDLLTTVLLAIATVLTAWAGFQASKWSGEQAINFNRAGAARVDSARVSAEAGQLATIDANTWLAWLSEVQRVAERPEFDDAATNPNIGRSLLAEITEGDSLAGFLFQRFRPEFKPAVQAWLDTDPFGSSDAPATPFEMAEYRLSAQVEAAGLADDAEGHAAAARDNNQQSDDYVLLTVLFASVLFCAGLSLKMKTQGTQLAIFGIGLVILVVALVSLSVQPIEIGSPKLF